MSELKIQKIRFILFRNDGKVRVFINKRPPTGQGTVVMETEEIKQKMRDIPYNQWRFNPETKEVYAVAPRPVNIAALIIPEEEPLPKFEPATLKMEPKKERGVAWIVGAGGAGVLIGYVLKLLLGML